MRGDLHFQIQVACRAAAHAGTALTGQPNALTRRGAGRQPHIQRLAVFETQTLAGALKGLFERDFQARLLIRAHGLETACLEAPRSRSLRKPAAAEQGFEEVAEAAAPRSRPETACGMTARGVLPARRRAEILPSAPVGAELIVSPAFFGIAQHFVGFAQLLETLLRVRLLADIRVIFARQPPIVLLYLLRSGFAIHPEDLVIIFVFHTPGIRVRAINKERRGERGA